MLVSWVVYQAYLDIRSTAAECLAQVVVNGKDVPAPIATFKEAAWDEKVALNVQRCKYRWARSL